MRFLKNGTPSETSIQKAAIQWVRLQPFKDLVIHIPNEGKRSKRFGATLKAMGMQPGAWDILIMAGKWGYIGAWIEFKSKDGKLTPEQVSFGETVRREGYFTAVVYSIDEAIKTIQWYAKGNKTQTIR